MAADKLPPDDSRARRAGRVRVQQMVGMRGAGESSGLAVSRKGHLAAGAMEFLAACISPASRRRRSCFVPLGLPLVRRGELPISPSNHTDVLADRLEVRWVLRRGVDELRRRAEQ